MEAFLCILIQVNKVIFTYNSHRMVGNKYKITLFKLGHENHAAWLYLLQTETLNVDKKLVIGNTCTFLGDIDNM